VVAVVVPRHQAIIIRKGQTGKNSLVMGMTQSPLKCEANHIDTTRFEGTVPPRQAAGVPNQFLGVRDGVSRVAILRRQLR